MADIKPTATALRFGDKFDDCVTRYANLITVSGRGTFPVPGLSVTNVRGENCSCMTPQGITVAKNYLLISAYCNSEKYRTDLEKRVAKGKNAERLEKEKNHKQHKTVLYVLDKKTEKLITTLALDDHTHAGGITYDGTYVWVCKDVDGKVSCIKMSDIEKAIKDGKHHVHYHQTCGVEGNAIFCQWFHDMLWVADCGSQYGNGFIAYTVEETLGILHLKKRKAIEIPACSNGGLLVDFDGKTHFALTTSGGRENPSKVALYTVDLTTKKEFIKYADKECQKLGELVLPPMAEEICIDGNSADATVYTLFESASTPYSLVSGHPCKGIVDRVCTAPARDWFPKVRHI